MEYLDQETKDRVSKELNDASFNDRLAKNRLDFIDLLNLLKIKLSVSQFLEVVNKIVPRYFTIGSSSLVKPKEIRIMLRIETFKTESAGIWYGLFSDFIKKKQNVDFIKKPVHLKYYVQESTFRLPEIKMSVI